MGGRVSTLPLINQMNWKLQNINLVALALQHNTSGTEKARWAFFGLEPQKEPKEKKRWLLKIINTARNSNK